LGQRKYLGTRQTLLGHLAPPAGIAIAGVVEPTAKFTWGKSKNAMGYKIYWRETTSPTWDYSRYVGDVDSFILKGIVIDNYFFGIAAVGEYGHESVVAFPSPVFR
jgi:hypothetical protein